MESFEVKGSKGNVYKIIKEGDIDRLCTSPSGELSGLLPFPPVPSAKLKVISQGQAKFIPSLNKLGSKHQEVSLSSSISPFASLRHNVVQWAINFEPRAVGQVLQQNQAHSGRNLHMEITSVSG